MSSSSDVAVPTTSMSHSRDNPSTTRLYMMWDIARIVPAFDASAKSKGVKRRRRKFIGRNNRMTDSRVNELPLPKRVTAGKTQSSMQYATMPPESTWATPLTGRGRDKAGPTFDGGPFSSVEERSVLSPFDIHAAMTREQITAWLAEKRILSQVRTRKQRGGKPELTFV